MITGLVFVTFRKLSPEEIISLVQKAGLQAIEWGGDLHVPHGNLDRAHEVGKITREAGLTSLCYGSYYRLGESRQKGLSFSSVLETALALGSPSIRIWPGNKGSAEADPAYREALAAESLDLCTEAAKANVQVCYEFHGQTLTDTLESAKNLLQAAAHPHLKTLWQPPNGMDPAQAVAGLEQLLPLIHHLHVFHWWPTSAEHHPLSAGSENWKLYLQVLRQNHRHFPILLEFVANDSPEQFLADAATLKSWVEQL